MKRMVVFAAAGELACVLSLALASGGNIAAYIAKAEPFAVTLALAAGLAATCFAFGLATGDYSWVDRIWSVAPVLFAWIFAARGGFTLRADLAALLVTLWGIRLTRNFARRGGYSGTEDYRWSVLRARIASPMAWQAFNAAFICSAQLGVIALFSAPLGLLVDRRSVLFSGFPVASILPLAFLAYETEADREQWEFHLGKAAGAVGEGFCRTGLFRLSRHPAYFGELGFWWSLYLLCALGSPSLLHWSAAGLIALTALFVGSTSFTEPLSAQKYPTYAEYQGLDLGGSARVPQAKAGRVGRSA